MTTRCGGSTCEPAGMVYMNRGRCPYCNRRVPVYTDYRTIRLVDHQREVLEPLADFIDQVRAG